MRLKTSNIVQLHNLYLSSNIVGVKKSLRLREKAWKNFEMHVCFFVGKTKGKAPLAPGGPSLHVTILKQIVHKQGRMVKYGRKSSVSGDKFMW